MSYLQIVILSLIQGAAELLPVSSSAHVILAERLMGLDPSAPELTFLLVMLHTGTMFAVLGYFWPRWKLLFLPPGTAKADMVRPSRFHFLKMVFLATIVTGVLGLGLKVLIEKVILMRLLGHEKGEVEQLFNNLPLIAAALLGVGLFILVSGFRRAKVETNVVRPWPSFLIGTVQALCLPFRGFSRSGATISTALCCGISRPLAEEFSFALAVPLTPPVIALELHRLLQARAEQVDTAVIHLLLPGLVGMVLSFLAGLVALRFLSAALERGGWKYFGFYCILAAGFVLVVAFSTN
ncbi:MAG: undecaprenyl-diphosphate phosphatase, partial [Planctomycetes bacterium]|nr:undecaprenyl-diphosphate phosphatase [Planctomycetota bacterium]